MVNQYDWRVRVIHSGEDQSPHHVTFSREKVPSTSLGGITIQQNLLPFMRNADANIVCFDIHMPSAILLGILLRKKVPIIWWGHGFGKSRLAKHIKKQLIRIADAVLVYSDAGKSAMVNSGINPGKIFVAYNTMWVSNACDCSSFPKRHFLFVGNLQKRKRLDVLIDSFAQHNRKTSDGFDLVIIGDGQIKTELERLALNSKVGHKVKFVSSTTDEQKLQEWFKSAVAYVSPGDVGLGVLHAFAYGVPVITQHSSSHGPEFNCITNGNNGFVVPPDTESLVNIMGEVALNNQLAQTMGENAFTSYNQFYSPARMLDAFREVVEYVMVNNHR
ncbi:MAG: glycosyltransferase family 4 protein [Caldilineaceae bacterium]|nr:glycosyltransferase family 4 protein [Caldilineaceae bacterium]